MKVGLKGVMKYIYLSILHHSRRRYCILSSPLLARLIATVLFIRSLYYMLYYVLYYSIITLYYSSLILYYVLYYMLYPLSVLFLLISY